MSGADRDSGGQLEERAPGLGVGWACLGSTPGPWPLWTRFLVRPLPAFLLSPYPHFYLPQGVL